MFDTIESDNIDYIKGVVCAMHNDYFMTLFENYRLKNTLPLKMAKDIEWEFNKHEIRDEGDGCSDYEAEEHEVRDEYCETTIRYII